MTAKEYYSFQDAFPWQEQDKVRFKGYLWDKNGRHLTAKEAVSLFRRVDGPERLTHLLGELDGAFAVSVQTGQGQLLAVDPMGMFSFYFCRHKDQWHISDSATLLAERSGNKVQNRSALPEFRSAGFVLGRECLWNNVFRIQAGEVLLLANDGSLQGRWSQHFLPREFSTQGRKELYRTLCELLDGLSRRLTASLQGRTAVVPLSGGYDSRLIAAMLKRAGHQKVICFTYGRPNAESRLSEKVAKKLGYPWIFVDYQVINPDKYLQERRFLQYIDYAGNATSMPFLQEYFACRHLRDNKLVPDDSIFLPGHTGDYIAGSYVEKTIKRDRNESTRYGRLVRNYFSFCRLTKAEKELITERLQNWFQGQHFPAHADDPRYDVLTEEWDLKEKFAKFVFNAARVFPFFGYEFRLPLWDKQFRSFFRSLPFTYRAYKALYDEVLEKAYFVPMEICFHKEELREGPPELRAQAIRRLLRPLIPASIRRRRMIGRDYICYHRFTAAMEKELEQEGEKVPAKIRHFNAIICQWYAMRLSKQACRTGKGGPG